MFLFVKSNTEDADIIKIKVFLHEDGVPSGLHTGRMTLHTFNPDHDWAMAAGQRHVTPPIAAVRLRRGLCWLPVLWAARGDCVLVDSVAEAERAVAEACDALQRAGMTSSTVATLRDEAMLRDGTTLRNTAMLTASVDSVAPWGWDHAVRERLTALHVPPHAMPDGKRIDDIKALSHRRTAALLTDGLRGIIVDDTVITDSRATCHDYGSVERLLGERGDIAVKAPWSGSGRGVRFMRGGTMTAHESGWIKNVLKRQGCVTVEPYYNKVMDLAMEYICDGAGSVSYRGLSVFATAGAAYRGNMIASELRLRQTVTQLVPKRTLDTVREAVRRQIGVVCRGRYAGPVGVDMMVVREWTSGRLRLHPCVEINFRRTMGHVALSVGKLLDGDACGTMRITRDDNNNYKITFDFR